jgi:sugar phosphate isomerase/epimerase
MKRREILLAMAAAPAWAAGRSRMGVCTTSFMTARRPRDAYEFLEYAATLGAGGIQAVLNNQEPAHLKKLRARAESLGMFIELLAAPPQANPEGFVKTVRAAKEVGALCVRIACLSGRRYEQFADFEAWRKFVNDSRDLMIRAASIAEREKFPVAFENHKDWTANEMAAHMKQFSSEYLGVCLDTGNNISFLDDALETVELLAPYAISTHIKDMGVAEYPDGFLLSEVPLGEGILDLRRMMEIIRTKRPQTRFTLEMITRDPLKVPCLTQKYWVTFPDRSGSLLARTLMMTRQRASKLPTMEGLSPEQVMALEEKNVRRCLEYSRDRLGV